MRHYASMRLAALRRAYCCDSERRAFDAGWSDGLDGRAQAHTQLARTWPNAYARGYWEGVAEREGQSV